MDFLRVGFDNPDSSNHPNGVKRELSKIRHRAVGTVACSIPRRRLQSLSPIIQFIQFRLESESGDPAGVGVEFQLKSESGVSSLEICRGGSPYPQACRVGCYPPVLVAVFFAYVVPSRVLVMSSRHQDAPTSPKIAQKAPSWSQHRPFFFIVDTLWRVPVELRKIKTNCITI